MSESLTVIALFVLLLEVGAGFLLATLGDCSEPNYRKRYRKEYRK